MGMNFSISRSFIEEFDCMAIENNKVHKLEVQHLQHIVLPYDLRVKPKILAQTSDGEIISCIFYGFAGVGGDLIVISDPDLINNMGIGKKDNGLLIVPLLKSLVKERTLWIDEICHGLGYPKSILRALLTYPAICITIQALLIGLCLAWLVGVRFRPPIPINARRRSLEEQTTAFANITCSSSKHSYFLQKYLKSILQELQEYYPSIANMPFSKKVEYLDEIGKFRNVPYSLRTLYDKSLKIKKMTNITTMAKAMHQWKLRMISKN